MIDGRPFILMEAMQGDRIERAGARENPHDIATSAIGVLKRLHELPLSRPGSATRSRWPSRPR